MNGIRHIVILFLIGAAVWCPAFEDTFEPFTGMSGTSGSVNGQHGWAAVGVAANVQSNRAHGGAQSLEIRQAFVQRGTTGGVERLWISFWANMGAAPTAPPAIDASQTSLAFYVNPGMHVVAFSNTVPVELDVAVASNVWTRFDVYADYGAMTWDLAVGGTNAMAGFPLLSAGTQLVNLLLKNESTAPLFVDDILATEIEPAGSLPDSDGDGIPDWWEQKYYGGATNAVAGSDADHDGNTAAQEYLAGLNPAVPDWFEFIGTISNQVALSWPTQPDRLYTVYWTSNLLADFTALQADLPWTQSGFTNAIPANHPAGFYRVGINPGW